MGADTEARSAEAAAATWSAGIGLLAVALVVLGIATTLLWPPVIHWLHG
jgi:hypothetical protein